MIRRGEASSRGELVARTGLARSTVVQRLDLLAELGLVREDGTLPSTGGRPGARFRFAADAGVVLVADLGATHCRLAVTDLARGVLAHEERELAIDAGPGPVLTAVRTRFGALLRRAGLDSQAVVAIGLGVPGPVEFATGRPIKPPIMPGWDGVPIGPFFEDFGAPVLVDNDVNLLAIGEHAEAWPDRADLLFIKVGTGIGCGIVAGGRLHRGAQGAAGDIGHIRVAGATERCRCGNVGCLEAVAGGGAIASRLRSQGVAVEDARDVAAAVRAAEPTATAAVRDAGRSIGEVLAGTVNFFNPSVMVIGGDLALAGDDLLAGLREVVYRRSLALATRELTIVPSRLDDGLGIIGAAVLATEAVLAPERIDALAARHSALHDAADVPAIAEPAR
jgi:predicted NBD/HSP70 family sugar kinase